MSREPDARLRRQEGVTAHPPVPDHAAHDRLLVLRHAAGDPLDPVEQRDVTALLAGCPACAALPDELARIAAAVRAVPAPSRPRDFRLGAEQLAAHRPGRLARLLAGLPGIASPALQPLAGAAIAVGLVVAGLGALPGMPAPAPEPAIVMSDAPDGSPAAPEIAGDARAAASAASDAAAGSARMAPASAVPEVALLMTAASPEAGPNAAADAAADAPPEAAAADAAAGSAADAAAKSAVAPGDPPGPPPQVVLGLVLVLVGLAGLAAGRLERRGRDPLLR